MMTRQLIGGSGLYLRLVFIAVTFIHSAYANAQTADATYRTGLIFASKDKFEAIPAAHLARAIRPPEVDLTAMAPAVGDQGSQNSCVGWAVGYAARTIIANQGGLHGPGPFSPSYIYNRGRTLEAAGNPTNSGNDCNVGMQIETGLGLLQGFGVLPIKDFPYSDKECFRIPTPAEDYVAKKYVISGWGRATTREDVLQSLATQTPVIVGVKFYANFKDYKNGIYKQIAGNYVGPHALVILGYSDKTHAYRIMNSWGATKWGERGFGWIDYDTLDQMATVEGLYRAYVLYPLKHD
jgi:Papain family cysteine protease